MPRLSLKNRYPLVMLLISIAILSIGAILKPKKPETHPLSESDVAHLQQLAQRRQMDELSKFLSAAAQKASRHLLFLHQSPYSAVFWDNDGRAVSSPAAAAEQPVQATDGRGRIFPLEPAPRQDGLPFVFFTAPAADRDPSDKSVLPALDTGDWVLAVARNAQSQLIFARGLYQGMSPAHCGDFPYRQVNSSTPLSPALGGGGLFTLQGDLIGVITTCNSQPVVASAQSVRTLMSLPVPLAARILREYGMSVIEAPGGERVQITSVWKGGPAGSAGIRAGDVLTEIDGRLVGVLQDLDALADDAGRSPHSIQVLRGARKIQIAFPDRMSDPALQAVDAPYGLQLAYGEHRTGIVVRAVSDHSSASSAGVRPGDRLLAVDRVAVHAPRDAAKLLSRRHVRPAAITIERDGVQADAVLLP